MWRVSGRRLPSYYIAWNLLEYQRREEMETRINMELKNFLRKNLDQRYRLTKPAFVFLCEVLVQKTSLRSSKRVSVEHKVLCALSFYATGSYQRIVGMAKYLGQTTVSKYIKEVTNALNTPGVMNSFIMFPVTRTEHDVVRQKFYTKYGFPGVIGCVDGSHFHVFTPKKEAEHLFYSRKHYHSLNVQMICDSEGRIINVNPKYGGATHDAFIWQNSIANEFMQRVHRNNEYTWLLGDSGYPQRPWLMTPVSDAAEGTPEAKYNTVLSQTRVVIENTFGRLKNRWRCLCKDRTLHYKPEKCAQIIIACCVLHNLAIDFCIPDVDDNTSQFEEETTEHVAPLEIASMEDGHDLSRGRAMRAQLVERISRLH